MDTKRFNDEHAAKSRAVCERIEREDAERRGKLADLMDAQLKGELGRAKAEADGWRKIADRRLGHIGECEKALAKRNALIVELEMRVKELEGELRNADQLGEREFPAAKVLDADGMEIKVGDSMYVANNGDGPYIVCDIDENIDRIELFWHENRNEKLFIAANRLTHTRPIAGSGWRRTRSRACASTRRRSASPAPSTRTRAADAASTRTAMDRPARSRWRSTSSAAPRRSQAWRWSR